MDDAVRFEVHGLPELAAAFRLETEALIHEVQAGFIPEHRYAGMGGEPHVIEKFELTARAVGFEVIR